MASHLSDEHRKLLDKKLADDRVRDAAPDLLVALYNLAELCEDVFAKPKQNDDLIAAWAAIAKAEGRS